MADQRSKTSKVLSGTIIILAISVLAKISSYITDAILAAVMGSGVKSDAYYMVSGIQQVIFPMISIGIWKVFLPIYKSKLAENDTAGADRIANKTTTFFGCVSLVLVLVLVFFSDIVVSLVASGFEAETHQLTAKLVRLSSLKYLMIAAAAIYASMLQARERFFASQIREVASYIPTIIAALLFYDKYGVEGMAIALVIGGCLRLLVELPFVNWGYHYRPDFHFRDQDFRTMLGRLPSALLSQGVHQVNTLVDKNMASWLQEGSVTGLSYGLKLNHVFHGLLSTAITTALFPPIIEMAATGQKEELEKILKRIINLFTALIIPISVACIVYAPQIVTAAFKRGAFDEAAAATTAGVFLFYAISLFPSAVNSALVNVFYAYGDSTRPMYISVLHLVINVLFNLAFVRMMGINGLALATSLSAIIVMFVYAVLLRRYLTVHWKDCFVLVIKVLIISCVVILPLSFLLKACLPNAFLCLLAALAVCAPVYYLVVRLFGIKEYSDLTRMLLSKLKKAKKK